jgi:hypothetical protein
MSNTLKLGNGKWATGKDTLLSFSDTNNNYKPLPFSFSRNSSGTVVNKDGLIETVGSGEPRIDFKDNTKGALLLEPSRSNLIPYSNFDDGWELSNTTRTLNNSTSPEGNLNAVSLKSSTSSSNEKYIRRYVGVSASTDYTFSVFAKKNELSEIRLSSTGNSNAFAFFNLSNGTIGSVGSSATAKIENFGNGWYKCSIKHQNSITGIFSVINLSIDGSVNISTNVNYGVYLFGSQYEQGSYATSYIPTSGSAVTRVGDSCDNGGNDQVINSTEGVLYAEISALADDGNVRMLSISDGSTNNSVSIEYSVLNNLIRIRLRSGGVEQSFYQSMNYDFLQYHKIALSYKLNDFKLYIDGVLIYTDTSLNTPVNLNELSFSNGTGGSKFYGNTKDVRVYNTTLTDQELIALTQ